MSDAVRPDAAAPGAPGEGALAVEMRGIDVAFGPVRANRGAALEVRRGDVHALVGENGAGKSTLMRVLAGLIRPDAGQVRVLGRDVTGWSTGEAIAAGVGMVHQHFMLVPTLTVAENLVLGREPTRGPSLDRQRAEQAVYELAQETGLLVPPYVRVADLSVGEAQRVEILKTLFRGAEILVLDEPTAVLSPPEVVDLWRVLRRLQARGATVILITHKLDEVMEISDHVTVMRHGASVARHATRGCTPAQLAREMVGRDVILAMDLAAALTSGDAAAARPPANAASAGDAGAVSGPSVPREAEAAPEVCPALELRDLVVAGARRPEAVDHVSLALAPGEILGVAGVEGNGQTELIEAIAGLRPVSSGRVLVDGHDLGRLGVKERRERGLCHIPEDRQRRGLVLDYSVADNLILGLQDRFCAWGVLDAQRVEENAREKIAAFDIRPPDPALAARALSGGNQQKIVIAREMGRDYSVLLAAQPTRGVDVGAIEFIHAQLRAARDAGKAVLLVSADLAEIFALADRIAVFYEGRVAAILPREAGREIVGRFMTGAAGAAA